MIHLHRLEGFYWVVKSGGYAKAARAFPYPITQPAVHQQVRKLEDDLGLTLLERVGKDRMLPTPAAQRLYRFVAPFFERLPAVVRELKAGDYGGELHLMAHGLVLRMLMPEWLARLQRKRPGVEIHLTETMRLDLVELLRGDTDLVVGWFPSIPDEVASIEVAVLHPFLVYPSKHRLGRKKRLRLEDFAGETLLCYPANELGHDLQMQALRERGIVPQNTISLDSADTILGFVEAGLGYSLIPWTMADGPKRRGVATQPLRLDGLRLPVSCAWRKDTPENPLLDAVLETAPRS
jgi:DNA-binding transcriptional LysR family regulator